MRLFLSVAILFGVASSSLGFSPGSQNVAPGRCQGGASLYYRHDQHRNLDMLTGALDRQIQSIYCPLLEHMKQVDEETRIQQQEEPEEEAKTFQTKISLKDQQALGARIIEAIESSMTRGPVQTWTSHRPLPVDRTNKRVENVATKPKPWLPHDEPMPWFPKARP